MKRFVLTILLLAALSLAGGPFAVSQATPASAQGGARWTAEYYNNLYLQGAPAATTTLDRLSVNWGLNAPASDVNPDYWSARFATDVYFPAGTYRFYIQADDSFQLWIDFPPSKQPQFSSFNEPKPGETLTFDVTLQEGNHHIQIDFREYSGYAYIYVDWENLASLPSGPDFPSPVNPAGPWNAQYYNNQSLVGNPVSERYENSPSHNWGTGAPLEGGIGADFFSVRWTTIQTLDAGTYRIIVRSDDGVRVYVDNALIIDQWHGATDQTYSGVFNATGQRQTITVEYYEATGNAYLEYNLERVTGAFTQPQPSGTTATVLAYRLNVRNAPSVETGRVIAKIDRGATYPVVGRSSSGNWYQIIVNGAYGWVSGAYISINNEQPLPVTDGTQAPAQPAGTGYFATPRVNLNMRSGPSVSYDIVDVLPYGASAAIVGRNTNGSWWKISYAGQSGWVSSAYVSVSPEPDLNRIPITN